MFSSSEKTRQTVRFFRCAVLLLLPLASAHAARADTWSPGQMLTYGQNDWGDLTTPAFALLAANFSSVYFNNAGEVRVGAPNTSGYAMVFDSANAIDQYLPQSAPAGALTSNLLDPLDSPSGFFGGVVLALELNVDFSDAGFLAGSSGLKFGDLQVENLSTISVFNCPLTNGTSVRQVLAIANTELGGGAGPCSISDLSGLVEFLDLAFEAGTPDAFAQDNLVNPNSTSGGGTNMPEPSTLLLLAPGLAGLGFLRRRYARAQDGHVHGHVLRA